MESTKLVELKFGSVVLLLVSRISRDLYIQLIKNKKNLSWSISY